MGVYELARMPRITAGVGARARIATLAGAQGHVLLVADPGLKSTGLVEEIAGGLRGHGLAFTIFDAFQSDPTIAQADAAAALARSEKSSVVVCLGGGSALDLGKAVAAIALAADSAAHYQLFANPLPAKGLRKICVPTTAGTGSETTRTAILTRDDHAKVWLWGDEIKADEVVLDPELTVSLPGPLTAATGIDALVHAVEAATNRNANPAAGLYAHEAIRLVARHLVAAVETPGNLEARAGLQWAAAFAGVAIDNCGTAIAHALGHAMGSLRPIHHGRAVGIAMLASLPWNVEDNEAFAACAADMGAEPSARGFIAAYEKLLRASGVKLSLAEEFAGVTAQELAAQTARPENAAMRDSNRRAASQADLLMLARQVLSVS
ncbi:iron-containing alcohol dehydrogenase [Methylocapsa sp. S129]|uniref:iron-containing alcohol dehydrogenase n=1 Tax=Methylocapsa sp. S129 TaxID=1641869 RepID=UPI00131D58C6|nr:iron-containing alcohol dehydrogenase [Methylocapsa sp. S129]